ILMFAQLRLHVRRAVVDSLSLELLEIGDSRFVVLCPSRYDNDACRELVAVIQYHLVGTPVAIESGYTMREHHFGSKFLCLSNSPCRQFEPRNSSRKAKVIFNPRACSGLPTRSSNLDYQRIQAFRSGIYGRC